MEALQMKQYIFFLFLIIVVSCEPEDKPGVNYDTMLRDSAVNLIDINSKYDDYNSALPYPGARQEIYFSSNRNSNGNNFDIIHSYFDLSYHEEDDAYNIIMYEQDYDNYANKLMEKINSDFDEFGPYHYSGMNGIDYFFYANNEEGEFNIKFVWNYRLDFGTYNAEEKVYGPYLIESFSSEKDDYYPMIKQDDSVLYFCSNRDGNVFDIYRAKLDFQGEFLDFLIEEKTLPILKDTVLSSSFNDKCPFISEKLMVFTSDREGGFGGFDIYYSIFEDDRWSEPINFGEKINTEYNEYRPVTFNLAGNLMIFSSDRPGGKGGFDLYLARINAIINK